jgi:DnaJ-domain-containing protein 1
MIPDLSGKTAYQILGVPRGAGQAAIKRAYRRLAKYHPDAVAEEDKSAANAAFARINQAYEVLRQPELRRRYDRLLDQGLVPDLNLEVGEVPLPRLADILGRIATLNLPPWGSGQDQRALPHGVHFPQLINEDGIQETILEVLPVRHYRYSSGCKIPAGKFQGGCLIVTQLRVIVGMVFLKGSKEYISHHVYSFYYTSLKSLVIHEIGLWFQFNKVELKDEDGASLHLDAYNSFFNRLFLVANAYRLPLRLQARASALKEATWALTFLVPLLIILVLPAILLAVHGVTSTFLGEQAWRKLWTSLASPTGVAWTAAYLLPLLLFYLGSSLWRPYAVGRGDRVFGPLPVDYANGVPDLEQVRQEPALAGQPLEDADLGPEPARAGLAKHVPQESPPEVTAPPRDVRRTPPSDPQPQGPVEVEIPEAVRQALGLPEPAASVRPAGPLSSAEVCPRCGRAPRVPPLERAALVWCDNCNQFFPRASGDSQ